MEISNDLWKEILNKLEEIDCSFKFYSKFLKVNLVLSEGVLYIFSDSKNVEILKQYLDQLEDIFEQKIGEKITIFFEVSFNEIGKELDKESGSLLSSFSLKNFCLHGRNKLIATTLFDYLLDENASNVHYLWGNESVGKTSLIKYVLNKIAKKHSSLKILYIDVFDFSNKFYKYYKGRKNETKFISKFLEFDILVFDDLHLIKNKENINWILSLITKEIVAKNKKIVFIATIKSNNFNGINDELSQLIRNGCIHKLSEPSQSDTNLIISCFLKNHYVNVKISTEAIVYLSSILGSNISSINNRLMKIMMFYENPNVHKIINLSNLKKTLEKMSFFKKTKDLTNYTNDYHLKAICKKLNFDCSVIMGTSRKQKDILNRNISIYILKKKMNFTHEYIGQIFNKDHSTISHSLKVINNKLKEKNFSDYLSALIEKIF